MVAHINMVRSAAFDRLGCSLLCDRIRVSGGVVRCPPAENAGSSCGDQLRVHHRLLGRCRYSARMGDRRTGSSDPGAGRRAILRLHIALWSSAAQERLQVAQNPTGGKPRHCARLPVRYDFVSRRSFHVILGDARILAGRGVPDSDNAVELDLRDVPVPAAALAHAPVQQGVL
ncbi:hypothetical protein ANCCAN_20556 [Ancylostoma caninum]|uniref:Uncharacterized protein n=1 Tax=Ancylostoma caninum TaxID=29170 RepID=A0A368FNH2_ANCCA|nr:hypothetical protein ANCCAN_20556 [Ancylostoma caninum]